MHGLNTIKRLNKVEQDFVDHILSTPTPDVNLLDVWHQWKQEQTKANTDVKLSLHSNR